MGGLKKQMPQAHEKGEDGGGREDNRREPPDRREARGSDGSMRSVPGDGRAGQGQSELVHDTSPDPQAAIARWRRAANISRLALWSNATTSRPAAAAWSQIEDRPPWQVQPVPSTMTRPVVPMRPRAARNAPSSSPSPCR